MCGALVWPRGLNNDKCYCNMHFGLRTTYVSCVKRPLPVQVAIGLNPPAGEGKGTQVGCIGHVCLLRQAVVLFE